MVIVEVDNDHLKTRYDRIHFLWDEKLKKYIVRVNRTKFHLGEIGYRESIERWVLYTVDDVYLDDNYLKDISIFLNYLKVKSWRV